MFVNIYYIYVNMPIYGNINIDCFFLSANILLNIFERTATLYERIALDLNCLFSVIIRILAQ